MDNLTVFGTDFTGVTGIKATGTGNGTLTYIRPQGTKSISANGTGIDVAAYASVDVSVSGGGSPTLQSKTATPSTSQQTITPDSGYDGLSSVTVSAMPIAEPYVSAEDYEFYTDALNNLKWRFKPFVEVSVQEGDTAGYIADGTHIQGEAIEKPAIASNFTITPSTSAQTIGGANYMMQGAITVAAMPSGSVSASAAKGSVSNHAISVTPTATVGTAGYLAAGSTNGTAVSVSASELVSGTYTVSASGTHDVTNYASASVASGSATASATKGSVSNHSISVTPSVTRTAGYVTAGTASGTAVTVSASELVSGSETKTANGTYDVTNLASLVVAIPIVTYYTSSSAPTSSQGSDGDIWLVTS